MNWDSLFGANKLKPSQLEVPQQVAEIDRDKYARKMLNRVRAESFQWSFNMLALFPIIIIYSSLVVFSVNPEISFIESFKYPLYVVGAMFAAAIIGYRP